MAEGWLCLQPNVLHGGAWTWQPGTSGRTAAHGYDSVSSTGSMNLLYAVVTMGFLVTGKLGLHQVSL